MRWEDPIAKAFILPWFATLSVHVLTKNDHQTQHHAKRIQHTIAKPYLGMLLQLSHGIMSPKDEQGYGKKNAAYHMPELASWVLEFVTISCQRPLRHRGSFTALPPTSTHRLKHPEMGAFVTDPPVGRAVARSCSHFLPTRKQRLWWDDPVVTWFISQQYWNSKSLIYGFWQLMDSYLMRLLCLQLEASCLQWNFFAYNWQFLLFTCNWSFFAYNLSFFAYTWSFFCLQLELFCLQWESVFNKGLKGL